MSGRLILMLCWGVYVGIGLVAGAAAVGGILIAGLLKRRR
jgi:hypothetical protein